ncbi:MAG: 2-C-methyl-D-erythritol 4-phosphate cytidylyltransferase [Planctomycetota bacterium]
MPSTTVIVCAAGSGRRFQTSAGAHRNKLSADLCGEPVLLRSIETAAAAPGVDRVLVAGPAEPAALTRFEEEFGGAIAARKGTIVAGGITERYETVARALARLPDEAEWVLVHDAARPCTPPEVFVRVIEALSDAPAVVPAMGVADTLKRARPAEGAIDQLQVARTEDRAGIHLAQTPQGFHRGVLEKAYKATDLRSTDDAQLVERLGRPVLLVQGDPRNIKITRPEDLELARAIWPTLGLAP